MKLFIGGVIGLVLSVHVGAEPLLEGRVRLSSGQPAAGVQNEAPVNAQTDVGTTALMFAAAFGRVEVVRLLVENGADIHIQNGHNYTALSLAEERGHQEVVDFLRSAEDAG